MSREGGIEGDHTPHPTPHSAVCEKRPLVCSVNVCSVEQWQSGCSCRGELCTTTLIMSPHRSWTDEHEGPQTHWCRVFVRLAVLMIRVVSNSCIF